MKALWLTAALSACAPPAEAAIAVLANGATLKIDSCRVEGETVMLRLHDGGEVGTPAALLRGFVPDEIVEELAAAVAAEPPAGRDVRELAAEAARRHGLDPGLVLAVIAVESGFRPDALSPKGAQGLMQLMPATAAALGVKDAFDPADNLEGGTRHLRALLEQYHGDVTRALAAYNAGAGAVERHHGVPPYHETRAYVAQVLRRLRDRP